MVVLKLSLFQYFIVYSLIKLINYTSHKFDLNLKRYEYYQYKNKKMKNNNNINNNNRHGNFKSACRRLLIYLYYTRRFGNAKL